MTRVLPDFSDVASRQSGGGRHTVVAFLTGAPIAVCVLPIASAVRSLTPGDQIDAFLAGAARLGVELWVTMNSPLL